MSNETEKPETQADEIRANESQQQEIEKDEALPKPGDESAKPDGEVANNQPSQEGEYKANEPEERAEDPQPNPRLPPTPMHPVTKAAPWVAIGSLLAMLILYQCGYSRGQSEEHMKNVSRAPEKEVVLQTDEKRLNQVKSELRYYQRLWKRFVSSVDAGRCTKGAYSEQVSCTIVFFMDESFEDDLNEYLAHLEARNICASGEWIAVPSDAPAESAASGASAVQSAPRMEYKDELVFKFCQRPEFESQDSAE